MIDRGYGGAVYPVNPTRAEIDGLPCFPSIAALPDPVDCAVLAVADDRLEDALRDAATAGIPAAVVFGAAGANPEHADGLPHRLAMIAREAGMALCGGNCMGFYSVAEGLFVSGYPLRQAPPAGGIGVITHSGSSFSALANSGRGLAFNYLISAGQELVTTAADYLRWLIAQPETRVVGCFLETVRDPAGFVAALEQAAEREIPIVVLKVGRSEQARRLAQAHSGAVTGVDAAYDALFERYGVVRVRSLDELADTLELFASPRRPVATGLALATDSGGERALIADVAADLDLRFAPLAANTVARLTETLEPGLTPTNPLDLWGTGDDYARRYEASLLALAADPGVGALVFAVNLVPGSRLLPSYLQIAERVQIQTEKPFAVLGNLASTIDREAAARLRAVGIPVLMGTATGLAAIRTSALACRPAAGARRSLSRFRRIGSRCGESDCAGTLACLLTRSRPNACWPNSVCRW